MRDSAQIFLNGCRHFLNFQFSKLSDANKGVRRTLSENRHVQDFGISEGPPKTSEPIPGQEPVQTGQGLFARVDCYEAHIRECGKNHPRGM
ncbi:hypothetical protein RB195_010831 [Necator americanus]|uniref:Uncharacterized protein n=1 Tax=Necator americanus TaxID=51031 RepID=A0ABR1D0Q1_NECAM